MTWLNWFLSVLVILLCWCKRYSTFLISSSILYELFPVLICASNTGSLVNSLSGGEILIPVPVFLFFFFEELILLFKQ